MKSTRILATSLCAIMAAGTARATPPAIDSAALAQGLASILRQLEQREPPPPADAARLRYHVRVAPRRDGGHRFELARYNLGATVRRAAIADYGAARVAAPDAFGVGPHLAWRFRARHDAMDDPVPATPAPHRIGASRAASSRCGLRSCLALSDSATLAAWRPLPSAPPATSPSIAIAHDEEPPAQIALALLAAAESLRHGDGAFELVIDRNLGNDSGSEAILLRDGFLLRRRAIASAAGTWVEYAIAGANCGTALDYAHVQRCTDPSPCPSSSPKTASSASTPTASRCARWTVSTKARTSW